jgi:hypothetical protein
MNTCMHMCVCMYVCKYIYICIYVCMYICIYINSHVLVNCSDVMRMARTAVSSIRNMSKFNYTTDSYTNIHIHIYPHTITCNIQSSQTKLVSAKMSHDACKCVYICIHIDEHAQVYA